jgi:hypothetical protein
VHIEEKRMLWGQERIEKANGFVEDKRVNGTLAVARAIGDFSFKREKKLSAEEQVGAAVIALLDAFFMAPEPLPVVALLTRAGLPRHSRDRMAGYEWACAHGWVHATRRHEHGVPGTPSSCLGCSHAQTALQQQGA